MSKPSLPQGTRDFAPVTVAKRTHILTTIKQVFELYGFQPLETPALENLDTLLGKYGDEGDKLIFKILNNGIGDPKNVEKAQSAFDNVLKGKNDKNLTERALRYDLTIPFARYVAMNSGQLAFPFKRYQIQPVWRADRPQRGRYREFYQCDADVAGSHSLFNELEFVCIYDEVFTRLGIEGCRIRINSRKLLTALAAKTGGIDKLTAITVAIDKLDKIGAVKVKEELSERGLDNTQVAIVERYLDISGSNEEKIKLAEELLGDLEAGANGIKELRFILEKIQAQEKPVPLELDLTLARGLNYYTGIIFEANAPASVNIGSIGGGGRYDDLTGLFGVPGIAGVGISFGVDRIYDVMDELGLFPADIGVSTFALFLNSGEKELAEAFRQSQKLRAEHIRSEVFYEQQKIDKQYKYAEKKNIPFVITIEADGLNCRLKDIRTGEVEWITMEELGEKLKLKS